VNVRLQDFLDRLDDVRPAGREHLARCPAHDDHAPSLAVRQDGDRILMCCRSHHCRREDICAALGLRLRDLFIDDRPGLRRASRPLSPMAAARQESLRASQREAWRRPGVADAYQVADRIRWLWHHGYVDQARIVEAEVDAIQARVTWVRGLEAVADLLTHARTKRGWRGWSPGGDSGWLRRQGVVA
jgi:hypothetical protein